MPGSREPSLQPHAQCRPCSIPSQIIGETIETSKLYLLAGNKVNRKNKRTSIKKEQKRRKKKKKEKKRSREIEEKFSESVGSRKGKEDG